MKRKRIISRLLVLMLILGMAQPALAAETASTMQLSIIQGTVSVSNASGHSLTARADMRLYSGYQVGTAAGSYAWINLDSAKLIKLDANTKVEIRSSGKKLEVMLKSGSMYGDVSKPLGSDETMNIRTSTAVVGIRGTKFSVAQVKSAKQTVSEPRWTTQVQVYEGTVAVEARRETPETTTVSAGNQLVVNPDEQELETFAESKLTSEEISGYVAVELTQDQQTLENLNIDLSQEAAQELLEQDQADAARRQAEADAGRTGLETTADPNVVWGGGQPSGPSGGGGSGGGTSRPDPEPEPERPYTITFDPNGGGWNGDTASKALTTGADGRLTAADIPADPAYDGFAFVGWNTRADGSGTSISDVTTYTFTADTTLYARWQQIYTITFDPGARGMWSAGDTGTKTYTTGVDRTLTQTVPDPVGRNEKLDKFIGWFTEENGGIQIDPATYAFTADTTLYARWTPYYTIIFKGNGGEVDGEDALTLYAGEDGSLTSIPSELTWDNHIFTGWNTRADGFGTPIAAGSLAAHIFSADTILYAQWKELYRITFNPNSGRWEGEASSGITHDYTTDKDGRLTEAIPTPLRDGYAFAGWNTNVDGTGETIDPATYTFKASIPVYAHWVSPQITVYVEKELSADGSQEAAQQKIQDLLDDSIHTEVTVELNAYTSSATGSPVDTLYIKGALTVPQGKTLNMNCPLQVGSASGASGTESDGRAPAAGSLTVNGTFTSTKEITSYGTITNAGDFTCGTLTNDGALTNAGTGTVTLNTSLTNNASGTFTNEGSFTTGIGAGITNNGTFQLNAGSQFDIDATFRNSGTVTIMGDISSPSVFSSNSTSSSGGVSNQTGGKIEIGAFGRFENNDSAGGVQNEGTIIISSGGTLTTNNKFANTGTLINDGIYYGPALTGGTIGGINAGQVTSGNTQP